MLWSIPSPRQPHERAVQLGQGCASSCWAQGLDGEQSGKQEPPGCTAAPSVAPSLVRQLSSLAEPAEAAPPTTKVSTGLAGLAAQPVSTKCAPSSGGGNAGARCCHRFSGISAAGAEMSGRSQPAVAGSAPGCAMSAVALPRAATHESISSIMSPGVLASALHSAACRLAGRSVQRHSSCCCCLCILWRCAAGRCSVSSILIHAAWDTLAWVRRQSRTRGKGPAHSAVAISKWCGPSAAINESGGSCRWCAPSLVSPGDKLLRANPLGCWGSAST